MLRCVSPSSYDLSQQYGQANRGSTDQASQMMNVCDRRNNRASDSNSENIDVITQSNVIDVTSNYKYYGNNNSHPLPPIHVPSVPVCRTTPPHCCVPPSNPIWSSSRDNSDRVLTGISHNLALYSNPSHYPSTSSAQLSSTSNTPSSLFACYSKNNTNPCQPLTNSQPQVSPQPFIPPPGFCNVTCPALPPPTSTYSNQQSMGSGGGCVDNEQGYGVLIKALGSCGRLDDCRNLWSEITSHHATSDPSEVTYGCMFDALVSNNRVDEAVQLLDQMKGRGRTRPNTVMYSTIIKGFAQAKQLDKALAVYGEMKALGVPVNTVTYNSIVDACARVGGMDKAAALLEDMQEQGVEPDLITFSTIIKGYCVHGHMDKSLQLLKVMAERGIQPDGILYNSLLDGCVKAGRADLCEELWSDMRSSGICPSNFTLTILIKMYGRTGLLQKAFELVEDLPARYGFTINAHVYTCLMSACITNKKYQMAYEVFGCMQRDGIRPDAKTYQTIVYGCSKGGLLREAVQLVEESFAGSPPFPMSHLCKGDGVLQDRCGQRGRGRGCRIGRDFMRPWGAGSPPPPPPPPVSAGGRGGGRGGRPRGEMNRQPPPPPPRAGIACQGGKRTGGGVVGGYKLETRTYKYLLQQLQQDPTLYKQLGPSLVQKLQSNRIYIPNATVSPSPKTHHNSPQKEQQDEGCRQMIGSSSARTTPSNSPYIPSTASSTPPPSFSLLPHNITSSSQHNNTTSCISSQYKLSATALHFSPNNVYPHTVSDVCHVGGKGGTAPMTTYDEGNTRHVRSCQPIDSHLSTYSLGYINGGGSSQTTSYHNSHLSAYPTSVCFPLLPPPSPAVPPQGSTHHGEADCIFSSSCGAVSHRVWNVPHHLSIQPQSTYASPGTLPQISVNSSSSFLSTIHGSFTRHTEDTEGQFKLYSQPGQEGGRSPPVSPSNASVEHGISSTITQLSNLLLSADSPRHVSPTSPVSSVHLASSQLLCAPNSSFQTLPNINPPSSARPVPPQNLTDRQEDEGRMEGGEAVEEHVCRTGSETCSESCSEKFVSAPDTPNETMSSAPTSECGREHVDTRPIVEGDNTIHKPSPSTGSDSFRAMGRHEALFGKRGGQGFGGICSSDLRIVRPASLLSMNNHDTTHTHTPTTTQTIPKQTDTSHTRESTTLPTTPTLTTKSDEYISAFSPLDVINPLPVPDNDRLFISDTSADCISLEFIPSYNVSASSAFFTPTTTEECHGEGGLGGEAVSKCGEWRGWNVC
eukprot:GHVQ01008212.1.p1 GENE.GHVQ01008212.1~~GHVQ01008212.1.p1  ORF type:complete len:1253 (-),score=247.56 GHVQ01008212.1:4083-7841(-)